MRRAGMTQRKGCRQALLQFSLPFLLFLLTFASVRNLLRFFWNATRGHRLAPWRSPYLRWRIETYCGVKMQQIGFLEFWGFMWRERANLRHFLKWTADMQRYRRPTERDA